MKAFTWDDGQACCSSCAHQGASLGMEAAACLLFHPGILSMLGKGLVKGRVADSLWWDPAAGKQFAFWSGHIDWARWLQPCCLGELFSGHWWVGGVSLRGAPSEMGGGQAGWVTPAALPLLCRFLSSALRRACGQRSSNCVRACRAPAHHPQS